MVEVFPKRKPLLPIIHNPKAVFADKEEKASQVRCFYALAHRGANPLESDFHMQARLGFRRRNNNKVRLRPIELLPQVEKAKPAMATDKETGVRRLSQGRQSKSALSQADVGKFSPGSKQISMRPSISSRRNSNSPMGAEGRSSPVSVVDMDFAGVTWTTFSKVTDQTVGTVISGALGEMSDDYGASESIFERLDKDAKPGKARTPLGKKPIDRSRSEIISMCALPPQVNSADSEDADLAWKAHTKEKAALIIQSQRRGQTCRKSLKDHRVVKETAAVRLQKLQRGRMSRKKTREIRRKTMEMKANAPTVSTDPETSNPSVVENTPAVEEQTTVGEITNPEASNPSVVENTPSVEEQTTVAESTPAVEEKTAVSDIINSDVVVGTQDPLPARFSQLPSVGSWLRLR